MKISNEYFINDLNHLIEECVHDGADCGGSYHINTSGMIDAIETVLIDLGLDKEYHVVKYDEEEKNLYWSPVYITKK